MFLQPFYSSKGHNTLISAEQGSRFAKTISNDFNPIHDPDSKRFCVPGDLLFALVLERYGLSQTMSFTFSGMVAGDTELVFPSAPSDSFAIVDGRNKAYLQVNRSGELINDQQIIEQLVRNYVVFSGHNFPHLLVPLMAEHQVMINPQRPLVIYESMSVHFDQLNLTQPGVELADTKLVVNGKRGDAEFQFRLTDGDRTVGCGVKKLILSGLREYQQAAIDDMVAEYSARQNTL
ncbi:MAG: DUF3581 domain-containing protein [Porticoccaceae bacterium]